MKITSKTSQRLSDLAMSVYSSNRFLKYSLNGVKGFLIRSTSCPVGCGKSHCLLMGRVRN